MGFATDVRVHIERWRFAAATPMLLVLATGCAATRLPRAPLLPATAAAIPLRVLVCPGADSAGRWLARDTLFTSVDLASNRIAGTPAPDLVVVAASSRYRRGMHEKPVPLSTRLTEPLSILTLGVLPTYEPHEGEASLTFRRPASVEAPCAAAAPAAPTLQVRATPVARQFIAFWIVVPAVIALLPGWYLEGGDGVEAPRIDPTRWLSEAIYQRRLEILRFAQH
jgi:hypothetical protein